MIDKRKEPEDIDQRLKELNVEYRRLMEQHQDCRISENDGPCAGHGELWANALEYANLANKEIEREIAEYNNRLRETERKYESDHD